MKSRKRYAKTFYSKRFLPHPRAEFWPEGTTELSEMLQAPTETPFLVLGGGQHLRPCAIGERTFDVIRTDKLNQVLSVDRESKLLQAECGMMWGTLHEAATEHGLTLERSRLHPLTASIGGLLSRHEACHKELWDGDLKTSMVSLTAVSPLDRYRYLPAPRKASGPDMRWMFVGAEGLLGTILDATFLLWKPMDGRLWIWQDEDFKHLLNTWRQFIDAGVRVSWATIQNKQLFIAAHGIESVLRTVDKLATKLGGEVAGSASDVATLRHELEKHHPDQRENPDAVRTLRMTASLDQLDPIYQSLAEAAQEVEVWDLTRHRATLLSRFPKGTVGALSGNLSNLLLDSGRIVGDDVVHWPTWAQILKRELDPQRTLAIGP